MGAHALAEHARPRATEDLDIWAERTESNAKKVLAAVRQFYKGIPISYTVEQIMSPENILRLGVRPSCIEVFTDPVSELKFAQAWRNRHRAQFGSAEANFVGLEDLIRLKSDSGRPQDLADVQRRHRALREMNKRKSPTKGKKKKKD